MATERDARQKVRDDLRALREDTRVLLDATKDDVTDKTRQARERLEQNLSELTTSLGDMGVRARASVDRTVEEKPYQVIAGALGFGFLLGLLLGGRRS